MHPNCNPFISQLILWLCADTHIEAQLTSIFPNITQGQAANLICHSQHTDQTATDTSFVVQSQQGVCTGIPYKADESLPDEMLVKMNNIPDSKVHGAGTGPIWGRQDPGGPHVGPMNFAIWDDKHCRRVLFHDIFAYQEYKFVRIITHINLHCHQLPLLLTWSNFNPSMDEQLHPL